MSTQPWVVAAWVETSIQNASDLRVAQICLEVAELPYNDIRVGQICGEVGVDPFNHIRIGQMCVEVACGLPIIHEVQIGRTLLLKRGFPKAPGVPGPCLPAEPDTLPAPGMQVPLECFFVALINPRDSVQVGLDWSSLLGEDTILQAEWMPEPGIVVNSSSHGSNYCTAVISAPSVPDGTDLLLACKISTLAGNTHVCRIKVSVRLQDVPSSSSAASWWRI